MNIEDLAAWEEKLAIRRSAVLFMTLWMTWRAFEWAGQYALIQGQSGGEGYKRRAGAVRGVVAHRRAAQTAKVVML